MNQKTKLPLLALLGLMGIAGYFAIFLQTNAVQLLQLTVPRSEIAAKAQQAFEQSVLAGQDLDRSVDISIRSELFRYAQLHFDENAKDRYLALSRWQYTWRGDFSEDEEENTEKKEKAEKTSVSFYIEYDFNGHLVRKECKAPKSFTKALLEEDEALARAKFFLVSNGIDAGALELKNNDLSRESDVQTYKFEFERSSSGIPDIVDKFTVELTGDVITKYVALSDFTDTGLKTPTSEKNIQIGFASSIVISWVIFIIAFIAVFVKRLRHDELDFNRAKWIGFVFFVLMAGMIAIQAYPEWLGMLLGGGLSGLFVGAGVLIAFATTESINREVWPEKIVLTDLVFRGYFRVREIGAAFLNMVFMAGISLFILAGMIWLTEKTALGYLEFEGDDLQLLLGTSNFTMHLIAKLIQVCFIATVLLSFWPSFLRSKIQRKLYLILATGISLLAGGIYITFIVPAHIAFFLTIPLAFLWAWFSYKYDFLTLVLALGLTYLCLSGAMLGLLPDGLSGIPGIGLIALLVVSFIAGLYLLHSKHSVADIENYIPEYVSRIAERERLLKELEIARRIQLQFLPQEDPNFPNLEITGICKPAMEVGGDYFDFIQDGDRYFSVVIGDVSGKGVSAAFYMTMAKGIIKTVARKFRAPKFVLTEMNAVFYENTPREVFISAIYGIFDMQERTLTFARAGHNPLIMRKTQRGEPEFLNPRGLAIGLDEGTVFSKTIEETTIKIDPGDVFVFYTDGLSESMDKHGEEFGEERLHEIISKYSTASAQELLEKIEAEVLSFTGDVDQHDDFTVVVVKVADLMEEVADEKAEDEMVQV